MSEERLSLRKAVMEDAGLLFDWKNDSLSVQNSLSGRKVSWLQHICWLEAVLNNKNRHLYIAYLADMPVGQLRLDVADNTAEISYSIGEGFRGKGFGKKLLLLAEKEALKLNVNQLTASVLPHNYPSMSLFVGLDYEKAGNDGIVQFSKQLPVVYIRTDMNPAIATGHVMRCLSIADGVREQGGQAVFVVADEQPLEMLEKRGYEALVLASHWQDMEGELPHLLKLMEEKKAERLLVDSYQVTEKYLSCLEEKTSVIYLDDLDKFSYPVSTVICYANYWSRLSYGIDAKADKGQKKPSKRYTRENTSFFLGPDYMPLRKVFEKCEPKEIREKIERILILSGGTDTYGILEKLADLFKTYQEIKIDIICGAYYPDFSGLCEKYREYSQFSFYQNVPDLEKYMDRADFAISAGGTTLYELCATGTPALSYSFSDNQLNNVEQFAADGIIDYVGDVRRDNLVEKVREMFELYSGDSLLRKERSVRMQRLVDGKGAKRIAKILLGKENRANGQNPVEKG